MHFYNLPKWVLSIILVLTLMYINSLAHEWMAPKKEAIKNNPFQLNDDNLKLGRNIYEDTCAHCHGISAEGKDGKSLGLNSSPPDLTKRIKTHSDGDFFWKIQTGKNGMPSFKDDLNEKEIWSTVLYLRHISGD